LRGGMKTVLIPEENAKDLVDIPDSVKSGLEIVPVARMDEVLARTLVRKPEPITWEEPPVKAKPEAAAAIEDEPGSALTAH
jgi:ATP-dependent Lon protease